MPDRTLEIPCFRPMPLSPLKTKKPDGKRRASCAVFVFDTLINSEARNLTVSGRRMKGNVLRSFSLCNTGEFVAQRATFRLLECAREDFAGLLS